MSDQPAWLAPGARVRVLPSSSTRAGVRVCVVLDVRWPWLVYLEGWPGAVHPARCSEHIDDDTSG